MKNTKSSIAILVMAIVVFASLIMTSCKKETQNSFSNNSINESLISAFDRKGIKDMDAYLKDFKMKMQTVIRENDETMDLESAAWHIASIANRDFCNVDVEYDDLRFDTLVMDIPVDGGQISLANMNTVYPEMCSRIEKFQKSLGLNNQHLRFINTAINQEGQIKVSMITTFVNSTRNLEDHLWYFPDTFGLMDSVCYYYFDATTSYPWDTTGGKDYLQWIINMHEGISYSHSVAYFVPTRYQLFDYPNYIDPYGSPFRRNSRLFAVWGNYNYGLDMNEMCYCLDSYLGLQCDYLENNYYVDDEFIVNSKILTGKNVFYGERYTTYYHKLGVQYGQYVQQQIDDPNPGI